jgi:hypothetical protein
VSALRLPFSALTVWALTGVADCVIG